jgi:dTMP kinase
MSTNPPPPSAASGRATPRGALIVLEGLDRSGKTTQVQRLHSVLSSRGVPAKSIRFPDRATPIGQMINSYLQSGTQLDDHAVHLLFSANRWELAEQIEKDLKEGVTVIVDRYVYSGMVYSAAKGNPSLSLEWARECDVGLPRPDVVIFLDLESEDAEKRGGFGDEKYEKAEMQKEVRRLFYRLMEIGEEENEDMLFVYAGGTAEEVSHEVLIRVEECLDNIKLGLLPDEVRRIGKWGEREAARIRGGRPLLEP